MPDVKISQLPAGTANASAVVPATNAAGTLTEKITLGAIAALGGGPPASHTHGNITNAGAIGTTANLPVITGASGVLAAGSFGTAANTFCQGNDSRLSDARTPAGAYAKVSTAQNVTASYANSTALSLSLPPGEYLILGVVTQTVSGGAFVEVGFAAAANITGKIAIPATYDWYNEFSYPPAYIDIGSSATHTIYAYNVMSYADNAVATFQGRATVSNVGGASQTLQLRFGGSDAGVQYSLQPGSWLAAIKVG